MAIPLLNSEELSIHNGHLPFFRALVNGERPPTTDAQRQFIGVANGTSPATTKYEVAYLKFIAACEHLSLATSVDFDEFAVAYHSKNAPPEISESTIEVRPCAQCGKPIHPDRLAALPNASTCIECQSDVESAKFKDAFQPICPRCQAQGIASKLVWRRARDHAIRGYFLGCSRFPDCRFVDGDKSVRE